MQMREKLLPMCFVACLAVMAASGAELLNPSFEMPEDPEDWVSDQAAHWGRWGHWINRETGWTPTRGGDCLLAYHHFRIESDDSSGVYQDVPGITPNTECTFSVYAFKDSDTNVGQIELRLEPFDGGEALASAVYRMGDIAKGRWKLISVTGRNLTDGVRVLIICQPKSKKRSGALKFDEAVLQTDQ